MLIFFLKEVITIERIQSIDTLRGLVIGLMALDHVRDFWHNSSVDPTHILQTTPLLFATRWITHFCAPVFFLLAGMSLFYTFQKSGPKATSLYLVLRGLLLIGLEFLLFSAIWTGGRDTFLLQVIWALGVSMIVMAAGIWLNTKVILGISLLMIIGHNALEPIDLMAMNSQDAAWATLWHFLHIGSSTLSIEYGLGTLQVYIVYPLLPWIGVMGLGFCMAPLMLLPKKIRIRRLFRLGSLVLLAFFILRLSNDYGDPSQWQPYASLSQSLMSFINCEKYPPSLLYLLMTLGPSFMILSILEQTRPLMPLMILGKTALFFYILHLPLIYGLRAVAHLLFPEFYGFSLLGTYVMWGAILLILYPLCYGYHWLKSQRKWPWLKLV